MSKKNAAKQNDAANESGAEATVNENEHAAETGSTPPDASQDSGVVATVEGDAAEPASEAPPKKNVKQVVSEWKAAFFALQKAREAMQLAEMLHEGAIQQMAAVGKTRFNFDAGDGRGLRLLTIVVRHNKKTNTETFFLKGATEHEVESV